MSMLFFIVVLLTAIISCGATKNYRLSNKNLHSRRYRVTLVPNLEDKFDFNGIAKIFFHSTENFQCLELNSKDLKIESINLNPDDRYFIKLEYSYDVEREILYICADRLLQPNIEYEVEIKYTGKLNDDMKGLYKIPYEYANEKRWIVATQFAPTYTRMVFPCFDEPGHKIILELSMARFSDETCISTLPLVRTSEPDPKLGHRVFDLFRTSNDNFPLHLISFVKLKTKSTQVNAKTKIFYYDDRVTFNGEYALARYRNIMYGIGKYVGKNLPAWEVEWTLLPDGTELTRMTGLDLFMEGDLLYNKFTDSEQQKENIIKAIIHKTSHVWFQNFVNIEWWDNTWLIESFGTFLEYVVADKVEPEWSIQDKFSVEVLQTALFQDETEYSMTVAAPTTLPSEIEHLKFNRFIINKGAAIIKMLETSVGMELFHKAIQNLFSYDSDNRIIRPHTLWSNIQAENPSLPPNHGVEDIMEKWINNEGYPLVNVNINNNGEIIITQETYKSPRSLKPIPDQEWIIRVHCIRRSHDENGYRTFQTSLWSFSKQNAVIHANFKPEDWIICNSEQHGYYRVNYWDQHWTKLSQVLHDDHKVMSIQNRAMILDDIFTFATDGKIDVAFAFQLGTYLDKEIEIIPWIAVLKHFNYLLQQYQGTDTYDYVKHYVLQRIQHPYRQLGIHDSPSNNHLIKTGRETIVGAACTWDLPNCIEDAVKEYDLHADNLENIPAHLKYTVFCTKLKDPNTRRHVWDELWKYYKNTKSIREKETVLRAMGCADDAELLRGYVKRIVKPVDYIVYKYEEETIITTISKSHTGITVVLDLIIEMLQSIRNLMPDTVRSLISFINRICPHVRSKEHRTKLEYIKGQISALNTQEYEEVVAAFKSSYSQASKRSDLKVKNEESIKQAIRSLTGYNPPSTMSPTTKWSKTSEKSKTNEWTSTTSSTPKTESAGNFRSCSNFLIASLLSIISFILS